MNPSSDHGYSIVGTGGGGCCGGVLLSSVLYTLSGTEGQGRLVSRCNAILLMRLIQLF